jgi:hypothetical protein
MPMFVTLDLPEKQAIWATGANRTLEPQDTAIDPTKPSKDQGWLQGKKPPDRIMNWLQNIAWEWSKKTASLIVSNFWPNQEIFASNNDIIGAIFHPVFGRFMVIMPDTAGIPVSTDAHQWDTPHAIANTKSAIGIDLTRFIIGDTSGNLDYTSDPDLLVWNQITAATIGGLAGSITQIHTKYPDSDKCIVTKNASMRIAATGITGSWSDPTTPPATVSISFNSLLYAGDSVWYLSSNTNPGLPKIYKSTDDGDNWSEVGDQPTPTSAHHNAGIAFNRDHGDDGRLISVTSAAISESIQYSDDGGDSWTTATINKRGLTSLLVAKSVYYVGGDIWVICGGEIDGDTGESSALVSVDNGENWFIPDVNMAAKLLGATSLNAIACSKRNILIAGDNGINITSLSAT